MKNIYDVLFNPIVLFILIFALSVVLFYFCNRILKLYQFGQVVRSDGPETHLKKMGTPTMAGIGFVIIFLLMEILFLIFKNYINGNIALKISIFIIIFGLIGFIDDYLKISKKNTKGLSSIYKFILQILFAGLGLIICFKFNIGSNLFVFLFMIFIIVGTDNGVNFTDGLDGLCTLVTICISIFYIVISYAKFNIEMIYVNVAILAMLCAFLIFNHYPAKMFMGDTGSLFLGAYVAFMAIELDIQYFLPLYGIVYMVEVLSVILQVSYFKISGGKRIFKMAPIHHHFEKSGFSETSIVILFTVVTIIACMITFYLLRIFLEVFIF